MKIGGISTDTFELGKLELMKSPIFNKIAPDSYDCYINEPLEIGTEMAKKYLKINHDIESLLEMNNIRLEKRLKKTMGGMVSLRGEVNFSKTKESVITVYESSLNSIPEECNPLVEDKYRLTLAKSLEVHLAHEFFHYLEFKNDEVVSAQLPKVTLNKVFRWERTAEVIQSSEIAAHAFAKKFCGLNVLPNYYDFIYINKNN